jgi:hypothetical protein
MKIFIDTENKNIEVISDTSEAVAPFLDIFFSVPKEIDFLDPFRFGYNLLDGKTTVSTGSYPVGDNKFISTDQDYLVSERVDVIEPNKSYDVLVWAIHGTDYFEKLLTFDISNLGQPFPSWIFDSVNHHWSAPEPRPTDGLQYLWNEDARKWEKFTPRIFPTV